MFILQNRSFGIATTLLVLFAQLSITGQDLNQEFKKARKLSITSFEEGDFKTALPGFKTMMKYEPGNAMHKYHAGICLVELNEKLDEAIELLYTASRQEVPNDVYYYLGSAFHRDYNFAAAQKYYSRFESNASRQEQKEFRVKQLLNTCRSAKEITASYNPFEVMNVTFLNLFDSVQFSQIKMKGGQLQRKPNTYFRIDENKNDLNSLMFMPSNPVRGDYIFYSGYNRNGKGGSQLFRVKKGRGLNWGDSEEISELNSEGNELLPYFDPIESDLYFASDGRPGIGGFDLYRTHYDKERDEWSEPINLGFPINSVMDEYLLLPGTDLGMVMFFSTRQGTDSTVTVYRVHLVEPKKKTAANDNQMLKEIASLGGIAEEILADIESISVEQETKASNKTIPEITQVTVLNTENKKPDYQITLAEALAHQSTSDSLKDLAQAARIKVRESDDPNDRWVWQKQIMVWEKKARDAEVIADKLYASMKEQRISQIQRPSVNRPESRPSAELPETIEVDTVMDELTVYKYENSVPVIKGEPGTQPARDEFTSNPANRFAILSRSPYSETNPVPMDVALPQGAYYRIQLGAFGSELEPDAFGGISPITGERITDRGLIKYYAGKFSKYDDASLALARIRSGGYEDAFIVAWYSGSPVSTQKAKQLE